MAGEYYMNWTDDTIKAPFVLNLNTKDTTTSSLTLFGKGSPNYGEGLQENMLRVLENFCSANPPTIKTIGQIWYDAGAKTIKYWDGVAWTSTGTTVASVAPANQTNGLLWLDTTTKELKFWDGVKWVVVTDKTLLTTHINDAAAHLTTAQNTLLDGLSASLTSTEVNYLVGVTSGIQSQMNTESATRSASDTAITNNLNAHINDQNVHLTSSQNSLIDAIAVTSTEINRLAGVTSNVQTQINNEIQNRTDAVASTNNALSVHTSDSAVHLTSAQNTLLDGLTATLTAAELNFLDGVTSNVQVQFNTLTTNLSTHAADGALHLSTSQNTLLDALTVSSTEINRLTGVTSNVQPQINTLVNDLSTHSNDLSKHLTTAQNTLLDALSATSTEINYLAGARSNLQAQIDSVGTGSGTHASDMTLHLTTAQNTLLDAITVSSTEINRLTGVTSGVQTQLDARYTKTEVDTKIADLVNSAPAALNTLNELAVALGNDANFAVTMNNALAKRSEVNPTTAKTGDIKVTGGVISIYDGSAWKQIFPAVYA